MNSRRSISKIQNDNEKTPEEFVCDGAPRERSTNRKKRSKGSFKKLNHQHRLHGAGYIQYNTSNLGPPKSNGIRCLGNCHKIGKKCDMVSDTDRREIFKGYYALLDVRDQRQFICRHVLSEPKKEFRVGAESQRGDTNNYFFTVRGKRLQVCKTFFLQTLAISTKVVRTALEKISEFGMLEPEKRGGRVEINQHRDEVIRQLVNAHIDRFPRIESHYCRLYTDREYLSSDLSLSCMHRMYCNEQAGGSTSVSYSFYCKIFKEKQLSFNHPKKDQCTLCNSYRTGDEATKKRLQSAYDLHITEKNAIREIKKNAKKSPLTHHILSVQYMILNKFFRFPSRLNRWYSTKGDYLHSI